MVKQITAYKTSDGRLFEDEIDAVQEQRNIDFKDKIKEFAYSIDVYTNDYLIEFLVENKDALTTIFHHYA